MRVSGGGFSSKSGRSRDSLALDKPTGGALSVVCTRKDGGGWWPNTHGALPVGPPGMSMPGPRFPCKSGVGTPQKKCTHGTLLDRKIDLPWEGCIIGCMLFYFYD